MADCRDPQKRLNIRGKPGRFATPMDALADILARDDLAAFVATAPVVIHADGCAFGSEDDTDMEACTCTPTVIRSQTHRSS